MNTILHSQKNTFSNVIILKKNCMLFFICNCKCQMQYVLQKNTCSCEAIFSKSLNGLPYKLADLHFFFAYIFSPCLSVACLPSAMKEKHIYIYACAHQGVLMHCGKYHPERISTGLSRKGKAQVSLENIISSYIDKDSYRPG